MKQLLILLFLPCLALAQYPGNANQKITLGEQTTADGLVFRGVASIDTVTATSKITRTNKQDTSTYLLLDTTTNLLWHYKIGSSGWIQAGGSTFDTTTLNLTSRFATKLNISDTLSMLSPYFRDADTTLLNLTSRFSAKQNTLTLTTTGTSGAATLTEATLNIPQYSGGGGVSDGDKGDIDVTNSGAIWTIDTSAITLSGNKVTGILPVANGGTNVTSLTNNGILYGSSTSQVATSSALTFNGTNFETTGQVEAASINVDGATIPSNGIYRPAANTLGFSTNATNKMTLDASGNFLVGQHTSASTTTPIRISSGATYGTTLSNGLKFIAYDDNTTRHGMGVILGQLYLNTNDVSTILVLATNSIERMRITSGGEVGIGTTSPTAALHLKAGTATANTAPLKFTSGTNLTTAEAGAMEFNGTNLFFSPSTTRHTVNHGLTGSATLDFPSTTTLLSADLTITVTGAADGDIVSLGVPNAAVNANTCYTAWVSAANTVTVRFNNYSSGTVNPASGIFKVFVTK